MDALMYTLGGANRLCVGDVTIPRVLAGGRLYIGGDVKIKRKALVHTIFSTSESFVD
jgi:hypothetical protein